MKNTGAFTEISLLVLMLASTATQAQSNLPMPHKTPGQYEVWTNWGWVYEGVTLFKDGERIKGAPSPPAAMKIVCARTSDDMAKALGRRSLDAVPAACQIKTISADASVHVYNLVCPATGPVRAMQTEIKLSYDAASQATVWQESVLDETMKPTGNQQAMRLKRVGDC
jgi:hypothetical protein